MKWLDPRKVVWFSCGAASAVTAYMALKEDKDVMLVYCDTGSEHPDNIRFLKDVEKWLGKEVTILRSDKYADHFDVIEKTRYVNGPGGARCTVELKKVLRFAFQEVDDIQAFGYTYEEVDRADRFRKSFPEVDAVFPLIEKKFTKEMCLGLIDSAGIELPVMYRLGFNNNNCIGCVKGGAGYWNKIREHFPEKFDQMAKLERLIGHTCIKEKFLDSLDPNAGRHKEPVISCDFVCQAELET